MPKTLSQARTRAALLSRLRSLARREGLDLVKDQQAGCWYLTDRATGFITAGQYGSLPDLDDVERCLKG